MNLVRHELGFSRTESRFPQKGTCLSIYSRAVNAEAPLDEVLGKAFPWCANWAAELKKLFAAYVEAKQRQNVLDYDDLLLYWAHMLAERAFADEIGARFDHILIDEYQDTNRLQASILLALKPGGKGMTVVGDDAQSIYSFRAATVRNILDFPGPLHAGRAHRDPGAQLSLHAADPCRVECRDRARGRALHQESLVIARVLAASAAHRGARRGRSGALRGRPRAGKPRGGSCAQIAGGAVPHLASLRHARIRADPPQHPVREIRRA